MLRVRACFMLPSVQLCLMLARVRIPSSLVRERDKEREGEREREREKEGGRERCRICPELLLLFLKGMMGALASLSYQQSSNIYVLGQNLNYVNSLIHLL